jgi:multidrug transporter EmrE-like cation transporter
MEYKILSFLFVWGILLTLGDIALKKWAVDNLYFYYGLWLFLYLIGIIFFAMTLRSKNLAVANIILLAVNIVSLTLVSYFYFKEELTLTQLIGIVLATIGIVLVELGAD